MSENENVARRYAPPFSAWRENMALWFGIGLFAVLLVFLVWLGLRLRPDGFQIAYFVFFGLLVVAVLAALLREWRYRYRDRQFCALMVDDEGLWPAHQDRAEALVRWAAIDDAQYQVATTNSSLNLLSHHRLVARVDRRLSDFDALCAQVFMRMQRPAAQWPLVTVNALSADKVMLLLVCFFAIFSSLRSGDWPFALFVLAGLLYGVYGAVSRLTVDAHGVALKYRLPRRPAVYLWAEIVGVALMHQSESVRLYPVLILKNGKTVSLSAFSGRIGVPVPCIDLYRALRQGLDAYTVERELTPPGTF